MIKLFGDNSGRWLGVNKMRIFGVIHPKVRKKNCIRSRGVLEIACHSIHFLKMYLYSMGLFRKKQLYFPAVLILAVVTLLLVYISFSTYRNFNRDREQTLEFVFHQGSAIIHAVESGAKVALTMPQWNRNVLARLIEETGKNNDIAYIYLYDDTGHVLYHSMPSLKQKETAWTPALTEQEPVKSRVRNACR